MIPLAVLLPLIPDLIGAGVTAVGAVRQLIAAGRESPEGKDYTAELDEWERKLDDLDRRVQEAEQR